MRGSSRPSAGFSMVEIVLGLTIISVLLSVTVTTYQDSVVRAREQLAQDEMRAIRNAIQRWQLDHRRPYPFESILPLVPEYLRNVKRDPWGGSFAIDQAGKRIISTGPDGAPGFADVPGDGFGDGDDVVIFFDTTSDVAPGPPQSLTVRLDDVNIVVDFAPPLRNRDGSAPVTDLDHYEVEIRSAAGVETKVWLPNVPAGAYDPATKSYPDIPVSERTRIKSDVGVLFPKIEPDDPDPEDQSYYFTVRAVDAAGNRSLPSNQAGLFVAKDVKPRIVNFSPSASTPAVSSPFSFFLEVTDADSNLDRVELRVVSVATKIWTTGAADPFDQIANPFRFIRNFSPANEPSMETLLDTTGDFDAYLWAADAAGNCTQTPNIDTSCDATLPTSPPLNIRVVNNPPRVTALNPGIQLLTVNPSATPPNDLVPITFTFEASDPDANLSKMTLDWIDEDDSNNVLYTEDFDLNPPGTIMVRTTSLSFDITEPHNYLVRVTAEDLEGATNKREATVLVKEDTTPPDALAVSLDPSNELLATQPYLGWFVTTDDSIEIHVEAFEIESPPIIYELKITTAALAADGGTPPDDFDNADPINSGPLTSIHGVDTSTHDGWIQIDGDPDTGELDAEGDVVLSIANGKLDEPMIEHVPYFVGMRALNSAGITNFTTTTPIHQRSFERQYPFRLDKSPPLIEEVAVEGKVVAGTTWITDLFDAEWTVSDPVGGILGNGVGSGPDRYRYRIERREPSNPLGTGPLINVIQDWQEVATLELNSLPLPNDDPALDNGKDVLLLVHARDRAGNWTTVPGTSAARIDFTSPEPLLPPVITNQSGGIISVLDTFSAAWGLPVQAPAFEDPESGIESWEWGIATTDLFVGFPDIFGWQPVSSLVTSATVSQNNLLVNGDIVHAVVRARNGAGSVSGSFASTGAIVDASLFTTLTGFPAAGISPLSVEFTATVTGGVPPYDVIFQFDGTNQRAFSKSTSDLVITTRYTYDLQNDQVTGDDTLPRPEIIARLIVIDQEGRESRKDFLVDVREDMLMAVGMENTGAVQIMSLDGANNLTPLMTITDGAGGGESVPPLQSLGVEPRGSYLLLASEDSDQVRFVNIAAPLSTFYRPGITVAAGSAGSPARADHNAYVFLPSGEGMLLQSFRDDVAVGNAPNTGYLRRVRATPSGHQGQVTFASVTGTNKKYFGAAPSANFLSEGLVVDNEPVDDQYLARRLVDLDTSSPAVSDFTVFPAPKPAFGTVLPSEQGVLIRPVGTTNVTSQPAAGSRVVPSRLGFWLLSQNEPTLADAEKGIVRVRPSGSGIQSASLIPFDTGSGQTARPTHLMGISEDGRLYVFAAGDEDEWELGVGRADTNEFSMSNDGLTPAGKKIRALRMDPGGTRVAMAIDDSGTGKLRIARVDFSVDPPTIDHKDSPPEVVEFDLDALLGAELGTPVLPADVAFFRRPNNGAPLLSGAFSPLDGSASPGGELDGDPKPTETLEVLLRGINLDRVQRVIFRHVQSDTTATVPDDFGSLVRTGLPPAEATFSGAAHVPVDGNLYYFLKSPIPPAIAGAIPAGASPPNPTADHEVEITVERDAGEFVQSDSITVVIDGL